MSSVKVYLAAILAYHDIVKGSSLFVRKFSQHFLNGLISVLPSVPTILPQWSLSLVLEQLMGAPFEPLGFLLPGHAYQEGSIPGAIHIYP